MKKRVIVAMSGGVDSSVAAFLLKESGYEVIGITMCFGFTKDIESKNRPLCCGLEGIEDAKRVCQKIGIKHYVLNFSEVFEEKVIKDFISEYLKGRTPNPCIRCNQFIKFNALLERIKEFDAQYLATGHYTRIEKKNNRYILKKGKDKKRDQSYFLYPIKKRNFRHILFPLGEITKEEVREIAEKIDLCVAKKPASQEICFIPDGDYRRFLEHRLTQIKTQISPSTTLRANGERSRTISTDIKPGKILDKEGNILGEHKGICFYTIGQREGLNINNRPGPFYVIFINSKKNEIIVGNKEETKSYGLIVKELNFISIDFPKKPVVLKARIRYNHRETESEIFPLNNKRVRVIFKESQYAVTPGQSVVFYKGDLIAGGGIIESSISKVNKISTA